jgi:hypothetical protein
MCTYLARALVQRSGGHPVFFRHVDHFTCQHVVGISVQKLFYGKVEACACSEYQAFFPSPSEGLGTKLTLCMLCADANSIVCVQHCAVWHVPNSHSGGTGGGGGRGPTFQG